MIVWNAFRNMLRAAARDPVWAIGMPLLAYLAAAGAFGLVFIKQLIGNSPMILIASGLFFAASFTFDNPVVLNLLGSFESGFVLYVIEDGCKFTGILLWLTWLFRTSLQTIQARPGHRGEARGL